MEDEIAGEQGAGFLVQQRKIPAAVPGQRHKPQTASAEHHLSCAHIALRQRDLGAFHPVRKDAVHRIGKAFDIVQQFLARGGQRMHDFGREGGSPHRVIGMQMADIHAGHRLSGGGLCQLPERLAMRQ